MAQDQIGDHAAENDAAPVVEMGLVGAVEVVALGRGVADGLIGGGGEVSVGIHE